MWLIFQIAIVGLTLWFSNVVARDTGQAFGYAPVVMGFALAFIATCFLSALIDLFSRHSRPKSGPKPSVGILLESSIAKPRLHPPRHYSPASYSRSKNGRQSAQCSPLGSSRLPSKESSSRA